MLMDAKWPPNKAPQERRSPVMMDRTMKRCLELWSEAPAELFGLGRSVARVALPFSPANQARLSKSNRTVSKACTPTEPDGLLLLDYQGEGGAGDSVFGLVSRVSSSGAMDSPPEARSEIL